MDIKKWVPTIITVGLSLVAAFTPAAQHFWSQHPEASSLLAGVYAIVKGLLPTPLGEDVLNKS